MKNLRHKSGKMLVSSLICKWKSIFPGRSNLFFISLEFQCCNCPVLTRLPTLHLTFCLPLINIDILGPLLMSWKRNSPNIFINFYRFFLTNCIVPPSLIMSLHVLMKTCLWNKKKTFSLLALNLPLNYSLHCFLVCK